MCVRVFLAVIVVFACSSVANAQVPAFDDLLRGDANNDFQVSIADSSYVTNWLFRSGSPPPCVKAADVNDDGRVDLADSSYLNHYLFMGGPMPPPPFPMCGGDPTADNLTCYNSAC